jgi:hypothetical protein
MPALNSSSTTLGFLFRLLSDKGSKEARVARKEKVVGKEGKEGRQR